MRESPHAGTSLALTDRTGPGAAVAVGAGLQEGDIGQPAFLMSLLSITTIAFGGGAFSSPCAASGGLLQSPRAEWAAPHGRSGSEPRFVSAAAPGEAEPSEQSRTSRGPGESMRASSAAR